MFTGIVQQLGKVRANSGKRLRVHARLGRLPRGASVAVNGTCLTVVARQRDVLDFDVSPETLRLTNLGGLAPGDPVNIETPLKASDYIGGHWVSGHVDSVAKVLETESQSGGFRRVRIGLPARFKAFVARKGSIAVDGASLTVTRVGRNWFETALIPETLERTTLGARRPGHRVNIEVDLMARYVVNVLDALGKTRKRKR